MSVIIGVPICESKMYIWDKWIKNIQTMQSQTINNTKLVFAVNADDDLVFCSKLAEYGEFILYDAVVPPGQEAWLYNIAAAREALRRYTLRNNADYLFMADCDMTYEPLSIDKMINVIQGYDAVFSAYRVRQTGSWGWGSSPALYTNSILRRFHWHVQYWTPKRFIAEDEMQDFDFAIIGARVNRGAFIANTHYADADTGHLLQPPLEIPLFRKITTSLPFRFVIIGLSRLCHRSLAWPLYKVVHIWLRIP